MQSKPKTYFRFFDAIGGIETLKRLCVRLNYACSFNDKYELNPKTFIQNTIENLSFENFKKVAKELPLMNIIPAEGLPSLYHEQKEAEKRNVERMRLIFDHFRKNNLILCLTTEINSLSMWDRYADQSEGIVIEFQASKKRDNIFLLPKPIQYIDDYPKLYKSFSEKFNRVIYDVATRQDPAVVLDKMCHKFYYTKTTQWQEEKEWRILMPTARFTKPPTLDELTLSQEEQINKGILEFWDIKNQELSLVNQDIKAIYLGYRCKISRLILNLKDTTIRNIPIYQGKLHRNLLSFTEI